MPNFKKNHDEQGKCPNCGSENINYGETEIDSSQLAYHFDCPDCGCEGKEWYALEFIEMVIKEENE